MKFLIVFAFAMAYASASVLGSKELKTRNLVVPAGRPESRITHGSDANEGQFPYQVGLSLKDREEKYSWCGGSVISNRFVLTAAHCTEDTVEVKVILGSTDRHFAEAVHTITSESIIVHPGWNSVTLVNDISLIEMPFTSYSNLIQPVKLPSIGLSYSTYESEDVIASGWGRVSDKVKGPTNHLQWARRSILPNRVCQRTYKTMKPSNICISTYGGVSTCQGDSGGPLVLESSGIQVGITSFGHKYGCELGHPTVFTRVTSYLDWIEKHTGVSY